MSTATVTDPLRLLGIHHSSLKHSPGMSDLPSQVMKKWSGYPQFATQCQVSARIIHKPYRIRRGSKTEKECFEPLKKSHSLESLMVAVEKSEKAVVLNFNPDMAEWRKRLSGSTERDKETSQEKKRDEEQSALDEKSQNFYEPVFAATTRTRPTEMTDAEETPSIPPGRVILRAKHRFRRAAVSESPDSEVVGPPDTIDEEIAGFSNIDMDPSSVDPIALLKRDDTDSFLDELNNEIEQLVLQSENRPKTSADYYVPEGRRAPVADLLSPEELMELEKRKARKNRPLRYVEVPKPKLTSFISSAPESDVVKPAATTGAFVSCSGSGKRGFVPYLGVVPSGQRLGEIPESSHSSIVKTTSERPSLLSSSLPITSSDPHGFESMEEGSLDNSQLLEGLSPDVLSPVDVDSSDESSSGSINQNLRMEMPMVQKNVKMEMQMAQQNLKMNIQHNLKTETPVTQQRSVSLKNSPSHGPSASSAFGQCFYESGGRRYSIGSCVTRSSSVH